MSKKSTSTAPALKQTTYARIESAYGFASVETEGQREGMHCAYGLNLILGDSEEPPTPITFRGEIERGEAVRMLRWIADELERLG